VRPAGLVGLGFVVAVAVRTDPRPALQGPGLVVLLALLGVVAGGVGLLFDLYTRRLPVAFQFSLFGVLIVSSATLVWAVPDGPGFLGGFVTAGLAASRLPRRTGTAAAALILLFFATAAIAGAHRSVMSILLSELGAIAFYRVGLYARRLRERTEQSEALLVELEKTRAAQLREATLAERQRLAREMHDVLAHSLSGLVLHLEGARMLATRDGVSPQLAATIERAHHLAEAGLGEARQAIGMLRDEHLPGPESLPTLAGEFERDSGVPCHLAVSGDPAELGSETRLTLYRIAQEALTNIRKHASPERVELHLGYEPHGTRLTIEDFTASGAATAGGHADDHGYGVSGMRERAELLGGTLAATSTASGFRVALWVPA
jgi:signal transduction histidine kinase